MKNNTIIRLFIAIFIALGALDSHAQLTALDYFCKAEAGEAVFCTTPADRLDMADYFKSGLDTGTQLVHDLTGRIISGNDRTLTWQVTPGITSTLYVIGNGKKTRLLVIETLDTPAHDSRLMWFDTDWNPIKAPVSAPVLADWLTEQGHKNISDVQRWLPFMTATAHVNDDNTAIIYTNTLTESYIEPDDLNLINKWIKPEITIKL